MPTKANQTAPIRPLFLLPTLNRLILCKTFSATEPSVAETLCWNRLFGSVHGRNDEQDWIGIVIVRDCDWHDDRSPGFEGGLECFSSTFQLIEQLPFLLDATVEAIGDVFHDHAPISTVRAMLQDTDTTTERPLSTPSRSATDDRKAVMRNRKNDKHIQR